MLNSRMPALLAPMRPALLTPLLAFMMQSAIQGQPLRECLPQGKPVTLSGRLVRVDEHGYTEWVALALRSRICALADPTDKFKGAVNGVKALQAVSVDSETVGSQLQRLLGKRVVLTGELTQWSTGYQRAALVLEVASVLSTDASGRALVFAPEPTKPALRETPAYEVTVRADRSLKIEAREGEAGRPLTPTKEYAPHWMTGGEVVYVNCRDGYERKLTTTTDRQGICSDDYDLCGFSAYPAKPLVIKFRCTKKTE